MSEKLPIPPLSNSALVRRMLALCWQYRWGCLGVLALQGSLTLLTLVGLALAGAGIDVICDAAGARQLTSGGWLDRLDHWVGTPLATVALVSAALLLVAALRALCNYFYTVALTELVQGQIVVRLRAEVYDKLQRLSFRFFDQHSTGSVINRVTSDVQSVRLFVDGVMIQLVVVVVTVAVYFAYMLSIHPGLTFACLATCPLLWLVSTCFARWVRPLYDRHREFVDRLVLTLTENTEGVQVVKGFAAEPQQRDAFHHASLDVKNQQRRIFWAVSLYTPLMGMLTQINLVILLGYGGYLVATDRLALGAGLIVFHGLLNQFSTQITNMANVANSVQQSLAGARRVFEILDTPLDVASPARPRSLNDARGELVFENVSFAYHPGRPVLSGIDLVVAPGERLALVGATAAGKSTLLNLIPRFYDPSHGRILLDGHDLREYHLDELRRQVAVVFQDSFLFSNSVAANIAYGRPGAAPHEVEQAAQIAAAHDFIGQMPQSYDTLLGERGANLSGGQRQRLAIARAILSDPAVLLLDDPTASVDPHTEEEILDALDRATAGRTTLIVAHRLSTLRRADRIVCLDQGQIVSVGTHEELLAHCAFYRQLAVVQGLLPDPSPVYAAEARAA
jgi:ATP-binding cassette subfamily B protein